MAAAKLLASELANIARVIKDQFFTSFDADASIGDVMDNLDAFDPKSRSILKALDKDDWLGFDNPVDAIDTALSDQIDNYEVSTPLRSSITRAANQSSQVAPRQTPTPRASKIGTATGLLGAATLAAPEDDAEAGVMKFVKGAGGLLTPETRRIATRFPTAKAATENPLQENLIVDLEAMANSGPAFDKNVGLMSQYNMPTMGKNAESQAESFRDQISDNLLYLYDQTPAHMADQAKLWYDGANKIAGQFAEQFRAPKEAVAGVLAALSPQKDWYMNVSLAERVLDIVQNKTKLGLTPEMKGQIGITYGDPKYAKDVDAVLSKPYEDLTQNQKAIWVRTYDEAHNPRTHRIVSPDGQFMDLATKANGEPKGTGWGSNVEIGKAINVLENPSMDNISQQMGGMHKVRNFYNNIIDPNAEFGDVTIDTHAVAAGLLEPFSGKSTPVAHNFGTGSASSSKTGAKGTYGLYADAYRQAAGQAGVLPRQMQSIAWENVRGLFPAGFKTKENAAAVSAIQNDYLRGNLTQDQARNRVVELAGGIETPSWYNPSRDVRDIKSTAESSFKPSVTSKGLLGVTGLGGAGGTMASPVMDKYTDPQMRTQLQPRPQMMRSPESGVMANMANTMGDINAGVRRMDPTGGLLAPELPEDLFRKSAYGEKRGVLDYLFGAMGMM